MGFTEVAAATRTPIVAAASGIDLVRVEVWDVPRRDRIASFDCALSQFGMRLAVADTDLGPIVVAGAWGVPGVRGYEHGTGEILWERRDLVRSGPIIAGGVQGFVAVAFGDRSAEILDALNGTSVMRLPGVRSIWQSPFAALALLERTGEVGMHAVDSWDRRWGTKLDGFALGAATFSPDSVLYSSAVDGDLGGRTPVVCRSIDGSDRWRFLASPGRSVPKLAWHDEQQEWLALEFDLEREEDALVRITEAGEVAGRFPVGSALDYTFVDAGRHLVTSGGSVIDTRSGQVVATLGSVANA